MTIQVPVVKQYFPVIQSLFITLFKVARTFEFVDEILKCDRDSDESYRVVLSCDTVTAHYALQGGSNF